MAEYVKFSRTSARAPHQYPCIVSRRLRPLPFFGLGIFAPLLRAWFNAAATACLCGRLDFTNSEMFLLIVALLAPFFNGIASLVLLLGFLSFAGLRRLAAAL